MQVIGNELLLFLGDTKLLQYFESYSGYDTVSVTYDSKSGELKNIISSVQLVTTTTKERPKNVDAESLTESDEKPVSVVTIAHRPGKLIRKITDLNDAAIKTATERLPSYIIKTIIENMGYTFEIVDDCVQAYHHENYTSNGGNCSLHLSCMKHEEKMPFIDFYNRNGVQVLILRNKSKKIEGRALLWSNVTFEGLVGPTVFMDRIYSISNQVDRMFMDMADVNGWAYKSTQDRIAETPIVYAGNTHSQVYMTYKLKEISYGFPYVDTLKYLDTINRTLTNKIGYGTTILLENTSGGNSYLRPSRFNSYYYLHTSKSYSRWYDSYISPEDQVWVTLNGKEISLSKSDPNIVTLQFGSSKRSFHRKDESIIFIESSNKFIHIDGAIQIDGKYVDIKDIYLDLDALKFAKKNLGITSATTKTVEEKKIESIISSIVKMFSREVSHIAKDNYTFVELDDYIVGIEDMSDAFVNEVSFVFTNNNERIILEHDNLLYSITSMLKVMKCKDKLAVIIDKKSLFDRLSINNMSQMKVDFVQKMVGHFQIETRMKNTYPVNVIIDMLFDNKQSFSPISSNLTLLSYIMGEKSSTSIYKKYSKSSNFYLLKRLTKLINPNGELELILKILKYMKNNKKNLDLNVEVTNRFLTFDENTGVYTLSVIPLLKHYTDEGMIVNVGAEGESECVVNTLKLDLPQHDFIKNVVMSGVLISKGIKDLLSGCAAFTSSLPVYNTSQYAKSMEAATSVFYVGFVSNYSGKKFILMSGVAPDISSICVNMLFVFLNKDVLRIQIENIMNEIANGNSSLNDYTISFKLEAIGVIDGVY